jgi:hypothetical protein
MPLIINNLKRNKMKRQEQVLRQLLSEGYKFIKTVTISMNGNRQYSTHILESPSGEKTTINFRGTVNSKNSLTT